LPPIFVTTCRRPRLRCLVCWPALAWRAPAGVWIFTDPSLCRLSRTQAHTLLHPDRLSAAHPTPCARRPSKGWVLLVTAISWSAAPRFTQRIPAYAYRWTEATPRTFQTLARPGNWQFRQGRSNRPQMLDVPSPLEEVKSIRGDTLTGPARLLQRRLLHPTVFCGRRWKLAPRRRLLIHEVHLCPRRRRNGLQRQHSPARWPPRPRSGRK